MGIKQIVYSVDSRFETFRKSKRRLDSLDFREKWSRNWSRDLDFREKQSKNLDFREK